MDAGQIWSGRAFPIYDDSRSGSDRSFPFPEAFIPVVPGYGAFNLVAVQDLFEKHRQADGRKELVSRFEGKSCRLLQPSEKKMERPENACILQMSGVRKDSARPERQRDTESKMSAMRQGNHQKDLNREENLLFQGD